MKNKEKCLGAYLGAAIGDAMGGPVECKHWKSIRKQVGRIEGLLPYAKPYTLMELHAGYAIHPEAGCVTDDTFIRKDMTKFFLEVASPRTTDMLVDWLLENAELDVQWPDVLVGALHKIKSGEVSADECGKTFKQGGGIGWWSPLGIVYAGNPEKAAEVGRYLSGIWKAPLEKDLLAAVVAGVAEAVKDDATFDSVVKAIYSQCGPLATKLLKRAQDIAESTDDIWELCDRLYHTVLLPHNSDYSYHNVVDTDPTTEVDGSMPPHVEPIDTDESYLNCFFAEQVPLAFAAFIFAKGSIDAIPVCCNIGRDCDTTSTTVGAWVGALNGLSKIPADWVSKVCEVNKGEMDLMDLAEKIYAVNE